MSGASLVSRRGQTVLIIVGVVLAAAWVIAWAGSCFYWVVWGEDAAMEKKRDFVLCRADHARIVEEAREMLDNPSRYFEKPEREHTNMDVQTMPPHIRELDPTDVSRAQGGDGVWIEFGGFALYVTRQGTSAPLYYIPPPTEIYPGLWYHESTGSR